MTSSSNSADKETGLTTSAKELWLIRHAKSSWADRSMRDFDRPLNERGNRDGPRMGLWCAEQNNQPAWIWCSSAQRTRETCRFVAEACQVDATRIEYSDQLYHASGQTALDIVRATPADVSCVAVIFHNPGITHLVNALAGEEITDNVPTFGIAQFRWLGESWATPQGFEFVALTTPKGLSSLSESG